ncbi:MAG: archease [Chloroflexi bacterium]|nr:archease [Chloroflexota bacterium]
MTSAPLPASDLPGVTFLDITADVGFEVRGPDLKTVFERAALATFSVLADLDTVQERQAVPIQVQAEDREGLLVEWLTELLYRFEVDRLLFRRFAVDHLTDTELRATAYGEPMDPTRHELRVFIKGVTYHLLAVQETPEGAWVRVVLDI